MTQQYNVVTLSIVNSVRSIINNTNHSFAVWKVYRQVHAYFIIHAYFKDSCSCLCYDIWHSPSFAFPCHTRKLLNNNHQYMLIWVQIWWYMLLIVIGIWQNTIIISNTCIIKSCTFTKNWKLIMFVLINSQILKDKNISTGNEVNMTILFW